MRLPSMWLLLILLHGCRSPGEQPQVSEIHRIGDKTMALGLESEQRTKGVHPLLDQRTDETIFVSGLITPKVASLEKGTDEFGRERGFDYLDLSADQETNTS